MEAELENTIVQNKVETEKREDIPFKRPILVGKIGHLPKKIKNISAPKQKADATEAATEESQDDNITKSSDDISLKSGFTAQYVEPKWSGKPENEYNFEVLKEGSIIETINLTGKAYWVFGRLANCDIFMQHPTVSRYHAVLQYRSEPDEKEEPGYYVYDLGSTHGTFLNKKRLRPRIYVRMQVGHILKIGCSTRTYLLNGPEEDSEKESEFTITELKQKRKDDLERMEMEKKVEELRRQKEKGDRIKRDEERGIDWGMGEDADEETDLSENPFAQSTNEDLYLDDPKKTLRGFFEREGLELTYDCSEQGMGQFMCKVQLPIDDERGKVVYAEVIHKGKKKDAVVQCALEACRILDRHGLLRQAVHESRKRKVKDWAENDYYDSDDDTFLDRTGAIEKKREKRMNAKKPQQAETYESLLDKEKKISLNIKNVQDQLNDTQKKINTANSANSEEDPLDAFMKDLKESKPDKSTINKLKNDLAKLRQEYTQVIKLVNLVRPANLPPLESQYSANVESSNTLKSKVLPVIGKRKTVALKSAEKKSTIRAENNEEKEELDRDICENESIDSEHENNKTNIDENKNRHADSNQIELPSLEILLGVCENAYKELSEKFRYTVSEISSEKDENLRIQNLQSLITSIKQATNNLAEVLNDRSSLDEGSETSGKLSIHVDESNINSHAEEMRESNQDMINQGMRKKKNQRRIQQRQEKLEIEKIKGYKEDAQKEDYNMWLPPKGQTGDGRTKLNDKFGY